MNAKLYRKQMVETTDDQLRYEFLKLLAHEGRQHFFRLVVEENINDPSRTKTLRSTECH